MQQVQVFPEPLSLQDQMRYPGPVWLDRVNRIGLASYGFGADVTRALNERERFLRSMQIDPRSPKRQHMLRELERRVTGERFARQSQLQFLAAAPAGFRGRVTIPDRSGGAGGFYAIVSDGSRFVVTPVTRELKASVGKTVVLSRDKKGRVTVRAADKDRGIE